MATVDFKIKNVKAADGTKAILVEMAGSIDATSRVQFETVMDKLVEKGVKNLILDCASVKYINSTGLGTLLKYADQFESMDGQIAFTRVPSKVMLAMEALGFNAFFTIAPDEAAVLRLFAGKPILASPAAPARPHAPTVPGASPGTPTIVYPAGSLPSVSPAPTAASRPVAPVAARDLGATVTAGVINVPTPSARRRGRARKRHALLVGLDRLSEGSPPNRFGELSYAEKDALVLELELRQRLGFRTKRLLGEEASREAICGVIESLKMGQNDQFLFFFAGHGELVGGSYVLHPFGAEPGSTHQSLVVRDLGKMLDEKVAAAECMCVIDACRAPMDETSWNEIESLAILRPGKAVEVLYGCQKRQRCWEDERLEHGVLTYHLVKALRELDCDESLTFQRLSDRTVTLMKSWCHPESAAQEQSPFLHRQPGEQRIALVDEEEAEGDEAIGFELLHEKSCVAPDHGDTFRSLVHVRALGSPTAIDSECAVHIGLVLDVSVSMDTPDKYPVLREAVENMLSKMANDCRVTVTLFSDSRDIVTTVRRGVCCYAHGMRRGARSKGDLGQVGLRRCALVESERN